MFIPIMEQVISFKGLHFPFQRENVSHFWDETEQEKQQRFIPFLVCLKQNGYHTLNDKQIQSLPTHQISRLGIGLVPQGRRIFPSLTIRENLTMPARKKKEMKENTWDIDKVYELFPS